MARLNETELHMLTLANKLDAIEPAARAMLAALDAMLIASKHQASRDLAMAAIAQAKAAGIMAD